VRLPLDDRIKRKGAERAASKLQAQEKEEEKLSKKDMII